VLLIQLVILVLVSTLGHIHLLVLSFFTILLLFPLVRVLVCIIKHFWPFSSPSPTSGIEVLVEDLGPAHLLARACLPKSVLENHHLALAFKIMANRSYNVFHGWDALDAANARKNMIACVLATDMDCHAALQDELQKQKHLAEGAFAFEHDAAKDKLALLKCVLHAADISNPTRPFAISSKISLLAIEEFNRQVVAEEGLGLPVTKHMAAFDHDAKCEGEIFFLKAVARPYFEALADCFPMCQTRWLASIDNNNQMWKAQIGTSK